MSDKESLKMKITSKAIAALIMEEANKSRSASFVKEAYTRVFTEDKLLTEDWVKRINNWAISVMEDSALDDSNVPEADTFSDLGPLKIIKKIRRNSKKVDGRSSFRSLDYIAVDKTGWKFWFRMHIRVVELTKGELSFPKYNSYVLIKDAQIKENKVGISFVGFYKDVIQIKDCDIK